MLIEFIEFELTASSSLSVSLAASVVRANWNIYGNIVHQLINMKSYLLNTFRSLWALFLTENEIISISFIQNSLRVKRTLRKILISHETLKLHELYEK